MSAVLRHIYVVCLGAILIAGCSGSKGPATAKVTGVVSYKGATIEGATVVFAPPAGGRPSTGVTDAQGRYQLSTFGDKDGAPLGDYTVMLTKTTTEGEAPNLTYEQMSERQATGETIPGPVTKNLLPEKYALATTSDLKASVKSGDNDIPLDLKD